MKRQAFCPIGILLLIAVLLPLLSACGSPGGVQPTATPATTLRLRPTGAPTAVPATVPPTPSPTPTPTPRPIGPGLILYESNQEIWQMTGDGTNKHVVVANEGDGWWPEWPIWAPDTQHFAFRWTTQNGTGLLQSIWIADRDGGNQRKTFAAAECASSWWENANILDFTIASGNKCSPGGNETPGDRFYYAYDLATDQLVEPNYIPTTVDYTPFTYSPAGDKVVTVLRDRPGFEVIDLAGNTRATIAAPGQDSGGSMGNAEWSPDGTRLAFTYCYGQNGMFCDLYTVQADGQDLRRLTSFEEGYTGAESIISAGTLSWSPDGQWIAMLLGLKGQSIRYLGLIPPSGGTPVNMWIAWRSVSRPVWSPNSKQVAFLTDVLFAGGKFSGPFERGQWDLYTVEIGTGKINRLTNDEATEAHISWK